MTAHPLKSAKLHHRLFAFLMDVTLVSLLNLFLLGQVILPKQCPAEFQEWQQQVEQMSQNMKESFHLKHKLLLPKPTAPIQKMLHIATGFTLLFYWLYFAAGEIFLGGSSLGKRAFRLKVIHRNSQQCPGILDILIRTSIKAFTLLLSVGYPFFLLNYLIPFFTKKRLAGHDVICRTQVVEEL